MQPKFLPNSIDSESTAIAPLFSSFKFSVTLSLAQRPKKSDCGSQYLQLPHVGVMLVTVQCNHNWPLAKCLGWVWTNKGYVIQVSAVRAIISV